LPARRSGHGVALGEHAVRAILHHTPDTPAGQPDLFAWWWEIVLRIRDGEQIDVNCHIEHVDEASRFAVFRRDLSS
jgi:hypothetical protein